jgi:predicted nucleotidyltransferase
MEFYRNAMLALGVQDWDELKERICEKEVVAALNDYIAAYVAYKAASFDYESATSETEKDLWWAYLKSTKEKKKMWMALQYVMGEDCDDE